MEQSLINELKREGAAAWKDYKQAPCPYEGVDQGEERRWWLVGWLTEDRKFTTSTPIDGIDDG